MRLSFTNSNRAECFRPCKKETNMLWTIFVVLLILWLLGFSLHIAGGLIHLLLVVALVVLVINLV
ncbi:MAG: lmo0937 family membrane protein, partial [Candidatus Sulfotelmatobacter sp.]